MVDGSLPVGATVGLAGAACITIGAVIYGVHQASLVTPKAQETTPENAAAIMATGVMTGLITV